MHAPNSTRLLFIFADMCEAEAIIQGNPFLQKRPNFYTYEDPSRVCCIDLLILTRWGRDGVAASVHTALLSHYHACVNMGFAGSASQSFPLHSCYTIARVAELSDTDPYTLSSRPELPLYCLPSLPAAYLVSSPRPYKYGMQDSFQLIDMEGYAIADRCASLGLPCIMIKIVSDYTTPEGGDYLKNNKHALAKTLCSTLRESLDAIIALTSRYSNSLMHGKTY